MAERVPELPCQSTKRLSSEREEQRPMISSTIRSRRRPASRLSVQFRNGRMAGRALAIIILCLVLIPLVQHNKILSPPGRPASPSAGDEFGPLITSPVFAAAVQPPTAAFTFSPSSPAAGYPVTLNATSSGGTAPYTFTWTPAVVFAGETVFFDGSSSYDPDGVIIAHQWQLGDGSVQTGIGVLQTYSSPGVYEVTLSVTDDSGVTVIKPVAVWVHPAMTLAASSNATQGLTPLGVSFSAQVSGGQSPYTFSWDFGDGLTSTRQTPLHNYTIPRVYRVEVTVADSLGHTVSQVMNITAITGPVELSFLGVSAATLKVGGILTAMSAFPLMIFMIVRRRK